jgi:hypothetical protein
MAKTQQQEVRWHVAQMFSYIDATPAERAKIEKMLFSWISSNNVKSVFVKAFCLQTISNFAKLDPPLRKRVIERLKHITQHGSPAMKSRSKKLIAELT